MRAAALFAVILILGGCQKDPIPQEYQAYKTLKFSATRSRPIEDLERRMRPYSLRAEIQRALSSQGRKGAIRILEIGQGNGRVLMTLLKEFADANIEYYGINKEPSSTFKDGKGYVMTALKFNLFTYEELLKIKLPKIVFADVDGHALPFEDNYFDIIFSQSTMQHIEKKFELLNENLRTLRPDGVALHTSFRNVFVFDKTGAQLSPKIWRDQLQLLNWASKDDSIFIQKKSDRKFSLKFDTKNCAVVKLASNIDPVERKSCYQL